VRPAMSFADSILQTASIARCVSELVTIPNHIIFSPEASLSVILLALRLDFHQASSQDRALKTKENGTPRRQIPC
jgi:hypothetical protein